MNILSWAVACFVLAAILGIYLLSLVLRGKETRKGIALIHGPFAAAGLVLLIVHIITNDDMRLLPSAGLFVVVALSGIYMFLRDITGGRVPKWLAATHGAAAAASLALIFVL